MVMGEGKNPAHSSFVKSDCRSLLPETGGLHPPDFQVLTAHLTGYLGPFVQAMYRVTGS